jgi:hypothetical protein
MEGFWKDLEDPSVLISICFNGNPSKSQIKILCEVGSSLTS